jgi:hypothetical protein
MALACLSPPFHLSLGIRATRIFQVGLSGLVWNSGIRKCYPKSGFQKLSPKFRVPEYFGFGFG